MHPLRGYSRKLMKFIGGSLKKINSGLGHRRAEHFFYFESTQFGLCTEKTYNELISAFNIDLMDGFIEFKDMIEIDLAFSRSFNLPEGKKFKSNVFEHKKEYGGFHPTQKPVSLLEDLIKTYSNAGNTVLDFTMGSGSTGVACKNTNRNFIGIELDEKYFEIAKNRISLI